MTQSSPTGAVSGREYVRTRPRGFVPWTPRSATRVLLDQVHQVLEEYRPDLPVTARQIFYRLVGKHHYDKTEQAYARLLEMLTRARRAQLIPMASIRDDRAQSMGGDGGYASPEEFWELTRTSAQYYRRPLTEGQSLVVEVWVEAAGMLPQISGVTRDYGVTCYASGGFESLGAKHDAAIRIARREMPTTVLSIGDLDPSGLSIVDAATEDVVTFTEQLGGRPPTVTRLAVTEEQVAQYRLETAPQKPTDRRGEHMSLTVQLEAMAPEDVKAIVRQGLEATVDLDALARVKERSARERDQLVAEFDRLLG